MGSCSLGIPLWPLGTGKDCRAPWMRLLRMPRVIFGSSKVSGDWKSAKSNDRGLGDTVGRETVPWGLRAKGEWGLQMSLPEVAALKIQIALRVLHSAAAG